MRPCLGLCLLLCMWVAEASGLHDLGPAADKVVKKAVAMAKMRANHQAKKAGKAAEKSGVNQGAQLLAKSKLPGIVAIEKDKFQKKEEAGKVQVEQDEKQRAEDKAKRQHESEHAQEEAKVAKAEVRLEQHEKTQEEVKRHEEKALKLEWKTLSAKKASHAAKTQQTIAKDKAAFNGEKKKEAFDKEADALNTELEKMKARDKPIVKKMRAKVDAQLLAKERADLVQQRSREDAKSKAERVLARELRSLKAHKATKKTKHVSALSQAKKQLRNKLHAEFGSQTHLDEVLAGPGAQEVGAQRTAQKLAPVHLGAQY